MFLSSATPWGLIESSKADSPLFVGQPLEIAMTKIIDRLNQWLFRPTREMLEDRIRDLTERLYRAHVQIKLMETERERIRSDLKQLSQEFVFTTKQAD